MAEILRSAGDTAFTLWARVLLAWAVFVPGAYLTTRYLGWREKGARSRAWPGCCSLQPVLPTVDILQVVVA